MTWYAGNNSINGGNNTGWVFTGAPIYYTLVANAGGYTYIGNNSFFNLIRGVLFSVGSYTYTAKNATLNLKLQGWRPVNNAQTTLWANIDTTQTSNWSSVNNTASMIWNNIDNTQ